MTNISMLFRGRIGLMTILATVFWAAAPCAALPVSVTYDLETSEGRHPPRATLLNMAFEKAVMEQALTVIGVDFPPQRLEALSAFLNPRAQQFVQRYSEISLETGPDGGVATYDVTVNRQGLERLLGQTGVLATAQHAQAYSLEVSPEVSASIREIESMEQLSGLERRDGVSSPHLRIGSVSGGFRAVLSAEGEQWEVAGETIESIWLRAWGGYFSRFERVRDSSPMTLVSVRGWSAAEGARHFVRQLGASPAVAESRLVALTIAPEGVTASFKVRVRDRRGLEDWLSRETSGRGLEYEVGN
ncbi:hypothetical protein dsat_0925 [Alkalidesulfovibrio alkalitolerans DSM 16529]|uniref:Uncharacterized protein n=1 Tax=Alkalidesulfovibrio alkalitolerans DSM 16529 TaxID=1121439 RepID=S7T4Q1_9BACT|nr:hypothetical protein [Alkalidesulfovibrio alkalitolerans]EPR31601.1 hypothetical protein dsat_0925 [Alkalidesulfovibrio alkalitolerans DSM 16529]